MVVGVTGGVAVGVVGSLGSVGAGNGRDLSNSWREGGIYQHDGPLAIWQGSHQDPTNNINNRCKHSQVHVTGNE